jgi:hypothetical protein
MVPPKDGFVALPLVSCFENVLQALHSYFAHSHKNHLEFTKLVEFMCTKGGKNIWTLETRWIYINVEPHKKSDAKTYKTLLLKMALDNPTN